MKEEYSRAGSKGVIISSVGTLDFYNYYCDRYENRYNISRTKFSQICKEFNEAVMRLMIYENFEFYMPSNLGKLRIRAKEIKLHIDQNGNVEMDKLRPDWKATKDLWAIDPEAKENKTLVRHFNEHFGRKNARFFWDKRPCIIANQNFYIFRASRHWKRELAKAIKNQDSNVFYYE